MLSKSELLQYSRHIILPEIDIEGQEAIKGSYVLIIGMGGLGSPAALYLAAAGIGQLTIIDDDQVERSNLQRQIIHDASSVNQTKVESAKASLLALSPNLKVNAIQSKADKELLNDLSENGFSAVLDCTDNFDTRFLINAWSIQHQVPLVSATAVGFSGQLGIFNQTISSPCYQCLYSNVDLPEGNCEDQGILSPVVGTMGTLQATETLKLIIGLSEPATTYLLKYDALKTEFKRFGVSKDPSCSACS